LDCDDNNILINPSVSEDCSNDYDDNCDGGVNEGCSVENNGGTSSSSSGGGGGGGFVPKQKPIAENASSATETEKKKKIVLEEGINYIDINKEGEEKVFADIYGNAYTLSFSFDGEKVIARVLNGDYEVPRGDVLEIGVGKIDMYVGVVESGGESARVAIGLDANVIREKVEKVSGAKGVVKIKGIYFALIGIVGILIVVIIGLIIWYFYSGKKDKFIAMFL
jgi:hypothetical protein